MIKGQERVLDIYLTPRFWKSQLVYDGRRPLLIFQKPGDSKGHLDQTKPYPPLYTRRIEAQDGMIYQLQQLKSAKENTPGIGIKMLVCVTMYNEPLEFLERTLTGIYKNFQKLIHEKGLSPKDLAVIIIQDGILQLVTDRSSRKLSSSVSFFEKVDYMSGKSECKLISRINQILDEIDVYESNELGDFVRKNHGLPPTIAKNISLLYQFQWKPSRQLQQQYSMKSIQDEEPSLQIFACFKHLNAKKLSSHLWFFEGFCRLFNPQFCTLMDIGTQPYDRGLVHFLAALESDKHLGGVSGFMTLDISVKSSQSQMSKSKQQHKQNKRETYQCEKLCHPIPIVSTVYFLIKYSIRKSLLGIGYFVIAFFKCFHNLFSAQRAQLYEYNYSHMLDKNFQSFFKYLNVLPGAWSAYRYQAISRGNRYQENLLEKKYLKMVLDPEYSQKDYKQSNMYLAQDRILCLGIFCQKDAHFNLEYVPQALAKTDPMDNLLDLMVQRRRWINSSYFAFDYVYKSYKYDVRDSSHNFFSKGIMLPIVILFSKLSILNTYLMPAVFVFALFTSTHQTYIKLRPPQSYFRSQPLVLIPGLICFGYLISLGALIIMSLYKKANQNGTFYEVVSAILGFYNLLLIGFVIAFIFLNYIFPQPLTQQNLDTRQVIKYLLIVNFFCLVLPLGMHLFTHPYRVLQMLDPRTVFSYLYYQAAYSHTFVIYAFCNVDDVSWGTKGGLQSKEQETKTKTKEETYYNSKIGFIGRWIAWNSILCFILLVVNSIFVTQQNKAIVLIGIGSYSTFNLAFRTLFAFLHHIRIILLSVFCQRDLNYCSQQREKIEDNLRKRTYIQPTKGYAQPINNILPQQLFLGQETDDKYYFPHSGRILIEKQNDYQNKYGKINPLAENCLPERFPSCKAISRKQIGSTVNPFKSQHHIS